MELDLVSCSGKCYFAKLYQTRQQSGGTMPSTGFLQAFPTPDSPNPSLESVSTSLSAERKPPRSVSGAQALAYDPLLTADDVRKRLNVSIEWVWDHSSRKLPRLPVIEMSDGTLRYRASAIEAFIDERERVSAHRSRKPIK
jgi:hypothetical protein